MNLEKKKIAFFGGMFNPFHNGHYNVCKYLIRVKKFDLVYIVIGSNKFFENNYHNQVSFHHKKKMIDIFLQKSPIMKNNIKVVSSPKNQDGIDYWYLTLKKYSKQHENDDLFTIIGLDRLMDFTKWKNWNDILVASKLIVFKKNIEIMHNTVINFDYQLLNNNIWKFSSTNIAEGNNLQGVNPKLLEYINKNSLYCLTRLNKYLSKKRVRHSINVGKLAWLCAQKHNLSKEKAFFAGAYHDYFKNYYLAKDRLDEKYLSKGDKSFFPVNAYHGVICANYLYKKWKIKDKNIFNSIKFHTTANLKMTKFAKLIYCADKISIDRNLTNGDDLRTLLKTNIDKCFKEVLFLNLKYLIHEKKLQNVFFIELANKFLSKKQSLILFVKKP